MKVRLFPADEYGCGYYRMYQPGSYALGCEVSYGVRLPLHREADTLIRVDAEGADVAVLQRPMHHEILPIIEQLQRQGTAVVIELDDDMGALDPHHISYPYVHPRVSPHANWNYLRKACAAADLVTCTTAELARRYAGHGRYVVLPNCIESYVLDLNVPKRWDIGWTGVVPSHPHDLQVTGTAIRDLVREGLTFHIVGTETGAREALDLDQDPPATGWMPLGSYYPYAAAHRVGIVPLADTVFNRAKSWLKGLEFAALGVPFVASPMPEYQQLQGYGAGMLATRPRHWHRFLQHLLTDEASHTELAECARSGARMLTIERNAWRWTEAWATALANRRGQAHAA